MDAAAIEGAKVSVSRSRPRSDAQLVRAAQAGSQEAVAALFERHWPAAHRAAFWVVHDAAAAEDIAQEAFLAAIRGLHRFDRRRRFAPWLHRVVVNRAIDHARSRAVRRELGGEEIPLAAAEDDRPDPDLLAALAALPVDQRAVVVLRHLLGHRPGEIATMLDIPRGTVNSRLRRGLDALREALDDG